MSDNNRRSSDADFTSVTFDEIKEKLVNRARTYYPDTYKDFNKSSFGSMMMDMVAMVSEQLNFYAQFVANENFIDKQRTPHGYTSAARKSGVEIHNKYTSTGIIQVYTRIPATTNLSSPDSNYKHTLLQGATFSNPAGASFTSVSDVSVNLDARNLIGSEFSEDASRITYYIYELQVPVVSGEDRSFSVEVGTYHKFLKIEVKDSTISEILKVTDSNGNEYYQVQNLSQNMIYRESTNRSLSESDTPSKLIPFPVPRRFVVQHEGDKTFLIFGFGSEDNLKVKSVADPSEIALQMSGRKYVSDNVFDPAKLLSTDKFGVSPKNTTLSIDYRSNTVENSNAAAKTVVNISTSELLFDDEPSLDASKTAYIRNSLSCLNEEPINGSLTFSSTQEIAETIRAATGNNRRAVTLQDYVASCYTMPSKFGSVKRASIVKDTNDLKRNLNLYVCAQDEFGFLAKPSLTLKNNLKRWLGDLRMISDSIDIYDASILNVGIFFDVVLNKLCSNSTALSDIFRDLYSELTLVSPQICVDFSIGYVDIILNSMSRINRVNSVKVINKDGNNYSDVRYNIQSNVSPDGGLIYLPPHFIWELKKEEDITGKIQ